jgi:hypothetical protein
MMTDPSSDREVPGRTDLSISMEKANVYSLIFALPLAALLVAFYVMRWEAGGAIAGFNSLFRAFLTFLIVFLAGVVLHELIHGLTWMVFGRKPLRAIQFGFQLKTLTPYAHCTEPMCVNAYRIGTVMPGILLGLLPALLGIMNGNGWLLAFGVLFTVAAGGDFLILWLLKDVDRRKLVEDHPTRAGCYILDPLPPTLEYK